MSPISSPKPFALFSILAFLIVAPFASAAEETTTKEIALPAKERFHLFLLAGQSNMAGRGIVEKQDQTPHPRVLMLTKEGLWKPAIDPIHYDKSGAGVGLGRSFAIEIAEKNKDIVIGLIPAACGGSPISTWQPGGYHGQTKSHPYDDAIKRTQLAMKQGTLKAILWHQGESDCTPALAPQYMDKLKAVFANFYEDLDAHAVPILIGQLGQFPAKPWNDATRAVDEAHQSIAKGSDRIRFISSDKLTPNKDNIHFDAASLRTFGKRYAAAYLEVTKQGDAAEPKAKTSK